MKKKIGIALARVELIYKIAKENNLSFSKSMGRYFFSTALEILYCFKNDIRSMRKICTKLPVETLKCNIMFEYFSFAYLNNLTNSSSPLFVVAPFSRKYLYDQSQWSNSLLNFLICTYYDIRCKFLLDVGQVIFLLY